MKIYVEQQDGEYIITLMDGETEIKREVATDILHRDKIIWELSDLYNVVDIINQVTKKSKYKFSSVPSIPVLNIQDAREFFEQDKQLVFTRIVQAVKEGLEANQKSIKLFELNGTGVYMTSHKSSWESGLQDALEYFISVEDYEKCSEIQKMIVQL